jgi:eukaryotic-like serine/threonine-protein kinase
LNGITGSGKRGLTLKQSSWTSEPLRILLTANASSLAEVMGPRYGTLSQVKKSSRLRNTALGPGPGQSQLMVGESWAQDGRFLVTGHLGKAVMWAAATGEELLTFEVERGHIWSVVFSPDDKWIVTGGGDGTARVWDLSNGKELLTVRRWPVVFSPDGQRIVTGSSDGTAMVYFPTEKSCSRSTSRKTVSVAISPDSRWMVTGDEDGTARVWDTSTEKELHALHGPNDEIISIKVWTDGLRIVSGAFARVWDALSGAKLLVLRGHQIQTVAFSLMGFGLPRWWWDGQGLGCR